jgi:hypothetical protein
MSRYAKNLRASLLATCGALLAFPTYADDASPAIQPVDQTQKSHIDTITPLGNGDNQGSFDISQARVNLRAEATRIRFNEVRDLASVIVIIDAPRARGITFGQLAAYVAMIGLAEIRIDERAADASSSILQLFATSGKVPPPGLSAWDEAFLKALYHTEHLDQHQIAAVKTAMVGEIAPH